MSSRQAQSQARRRELGLCGRCAFPALLGGYCPRCYYALKNAPSQRSKHRRYQPGMRGKPPVFTDEQLQRIIEWQRRVAVRDRLVYRTTLRRIYASVIARLRRDYLAALRRRSTIHLPMHDDGFEINKLQRTAMFKQ